VKISDIKKLRGMLQDLEEISSKKAQIVDEARIVGETGRYVIDVHVCGVQVMVCADHAPRQAEAFERHPISVAKELGLDIGVIEDDIGRRTFEASKYANVMAWRKSLVAPLE
jgi:hypothetical protein